MGIYAIAAHRLQRPDFMQTAINTADYFIRDMRMYDEQKNFIGYASAEDADDPGGEGSFYAWSPEDITSVLGADIAPDIIAAWDLHPGKRELGRSGHMEPVTSFIPQPRAADLKSLAIKGDVQALRASWEQYLPQLRVVRDKRPRPSRDDKALTDLNALALRGFSLLARYSGEQRFYDAAVELIAVLRTRLSADGLQRLPGEPAFITDYGHCLVGLTAAFELIGDPTIIDFAAQIANESIEKLQAEDGGFYTTPAGRADLIRRSREDFDNAYPSGIHSLAIGFVRLWTITGDTKWKTAAEGIFRVQSQHAIRAPQAAATYYQALTEYERGKISLLLVGDQAETADLLDVALKTYHPGMHIVRAANSAGRKWPALEGRETLTGKVALLCIDTACLLPAETGAELQQRLQTLVVGNKD
ncbi:MAG: thioredoxin domain-containing protein [Planctomycetes bacterium]|nr:thioredoxin domain-containing protein [Planctomycetota bacterium]